VIDYNNLVTQAQNYSGVTNKWADVIKHYNQDLWAVIAHPNHTSTLNTIENLEGWHNPEEL
jgi:hypothetical protein